MESIKKQNKKIIICIIILFIAICIIIKLFLPARRPLTDKAISQIDSIGYVPERKSDDSMKDLLLGKTHIWKYKLSDEEMSEAKRYIVNEKWKISDKSEIDEIIYLLGVCTNYTTSKERRLVNKLYDYDPSLSYSYYSGSSGVFITYLLLDASNNTYYIVFIYTG